MDFCVKHVCHPEPLIYNQYFGSTVVTKKKIGFVVTELSLTYSDDNFQFNKEEMGTSIIGIVLQYVIDFIKEFKSNDPRIVTA